MPHVIDSSGRDLGEITDPAELEYYRRESGFVIDGEPVAAVGADVETEEVETAVGAPELDGGQPDGAQTPTVEEPAKSAPKEEWATYAKFIDPEHAADIEAKTKPELVEAYGSE